jgi:hypothetical protein
MQVLMGNDVTWWKRSHKTVEKQHPQPDRETGTETPGDTNAADIVSRTGEEMLEVAHDGDDSEDRPDWSNAAEPTDDGNTAGRRHDR